MLESVFAILLAVSWKAPAIAAIAWLASQWRPIRQRPATQHALWTAAALTLLCLPALEALKQARPEAAYPRLEVALPVASVRAVPGATSAAEPVPLSVPMAFAGAYLAGLAVALIRLGMGWRTARRALREAEPVRSEALGALRRLAVRAGLRKPPRLARSRRFAVPVTLGAIEPAILLPGGYERWSGARLQAVLAHECAHVARHDTRAALAVALMRAVYWFHPLAWRLARHSARLMEQACDDFAVALTGDSREYAEALVAVAALPSPAIPNDLGALTMASHLSSRVDRILSGLAPGAGRIRGRGVAALAAAAVAATFAAALLTPVWAQPAGVALEGVVVDASGARVPGVSVVVRDAARGVTEATVSGADGAFAIRGLAASASYDLEAEAGGFARAHQQVALLESANVEVQLEVGRIREAIVVEADAPQQAAAAPARAPQRIRVGGSVQKARMIQHVQPQYPEAARTEGVEGTVLLEAVISVSGQPVSLTAVNNLVDSRLVAAATDAVSQWRYQPTLLNGQPVEVSTTITVGFRLRR
jgi:TonB family protein